MRTLFGSPSKVRFCKKCNMSNQRPSSVLEYQHDFSRKGAGYLNFNENGVCDACIYCESKYTTIDWSKLTIKNCAETLCFFDDHQNAIHRLNHAIKHGFKHLIFEDNYPLNQGDCVSLKKQFDGNTEICNFLRKHIEIYYEFPPVFKRKKTRWGDIWNEKNYPTSEPIFSDLKGNEKYKDFYEDSPNYTWIAYVKLK